MPTAHRLSATPSRSGVHLHVVRRDDHDVARPALTARQAAAATSRPDDLDLFGRLLPVPVVLDREVAQPRAERRRPLEPRPAPARAGSRRTPPRCSRQTSGCRRKVRSRKRPRSGGIVSSSPIRCSEDGGATAGGVSALHHLVELLGVADEDDVSRRRCPSRARPARDTCPASSMKSVVERSRRASRPREKSQAVPADEVRCRRTSARACRRSRCGRPSYRVLRLARRLGLLQAAEANAPLARGRVLDLVEQVVDRLVARRRRRRRACRARSGSRSSRPAVHVLPDARRPLDDEVAAVE